MPCEHYKEALIEAAAGAESQGELREHLRACPSCRAAFTEEQSLFSSIDTGLRAAVNAEIPTSFLPRVRAHIAEETTLNHGWMSNWAALAGAAATVVALFALQAVWRDSMRQKPVETATQASPLSPVLPPVVQNPNAAPPKPGNSASQLTAGIAKNLAPSQTLVSRNAEPEVLVPRDQEVLLVLYAEQWNQRKRAPLVAVNSDATNLSLLEIAPIRIARLDVKLMTEEQAQ